MSYLNHWIEYLILATAGLALMLISGYSQWLSTDLTRYSLGQYVEMALGVWPWWSGVGIPFLVGALYVASATLGMRARLSVRGLGILLALNFVLALLLWAVVGGQGFLASILLLANLVFFILRGRRANEAERPNS